MTPSKVWNQKIAYLESKLEKCQVDAKRRHTTINGYFSKSELADGIYTHHSKIYCELARHMMCMMMWCKAKQRRTSLLTTWCDIIWWRTNGGRRFPRRQDSIMNVCVIPTFLRRSTITHDASQYGLWNLTLAAVLQRGMSLPNSRSTVSAHTLLYVNSCLYSVYRLAGVITMRNRSNNILFKGR